MAKGVAALCAFLITACGPQLGALERGESGRVTRAFNGDALELDNGLIVFLAEIDAPARDQPYAAQAQGELEALTLHREALLAYGGARRWVGRPREGENAAPEAAIAHVFVKTEGGGWLWLQHEMIARGAAFVRPRRENFARSQELAALEAHARANKRGLWRRREYEALNARSAGAAARRANASCMRGDAPYRIVEGRVSAADTFSNRAALTLEGGDAAAPFTIVVFGENYAAWSGPPLSTLADARIRARGALGLYRDAPQMCLDHASQLEVLPD
jgi:endonuclease YncB( thermonuclease family)